MSTFITGLLAVWIVLGTALYINALLNWGNITNPRKRIMFGIICGPFFWLAIAAIFAYDRVIDPFYVRIRNWFLT